MSLLRQGVLLSLALCASLPGQQPGQRPSQQPGQQPAQKTGQKQRPTQAAAGPFVRVRVAGPGAIRDAILPTNLGALLGGEESAGLWLVARTLMNGMIAAALGDDAKVWAAVRDRLSGYVGTVELEVFALRTGGPGSRARVETVGRLTLAKDGSTDIADLVARVRDGLGAAVGADVKVVQFEGGRSGEMISGAGLHVTLPTVEGEDGFAVLMGSSPDAVLRVGPGDLKKSLAGRGRSAPGEVLAVDVDLRQVTRMMMDDVGGGEQGGNFVRRIYGVDSWDRLRVGVRTAGPHLQVEASVDFGAENRGTLAGLLPDISTLPSLVDVAPAGTDEEPPAFVAAHLRADVLYANVLDGFRYLFAMFGGDVMSMEEIRKSANAEARFDVEKDLLAHLGTEILALAHVGKPGEMRDVAAPDADGLCFVVRVTNDAAFAKTFEKIASHGSLRPGPRMQVAGVDVVPVRMLDRGEYLARTDGRLFYAIGERGLRVMEEFIERDRKRAAAAAQAPEGAPRNTEPEKLPIWLRRHARSFPAGLNAAGVLPTRMLGDSLAESVLWELWKEIVPRSLRGDVTREVLTRHADNLVPLFEKYRLDHVVVLGGYDASPEDAPGRTRARVRVLW